MSELALHLIELRRQLIRSLVVVGLLFLMTAPFSRQWYDFIATPLTSKLPEQSSLIAVDVTTPFLVPVTLSFYTALFLAVPWLLYEVWRFVAPGLYAKEKRMLAPLLFSSVVLFYAGVGFAWWIVLPGVFEFLIEFSPSSTLPMTDMQSYLNFVVKLFAVFGLTFEIPVAVLILVLSGSLSAQSLSRQRRYIIVGCFVVAAVVTPPDGLSMLLLALPMWGLFELGLLLAKQLKPES